MKIALISHEYPPDTALGGIATYVYQVARLLKNRGHYVEVFSRSPDRQGTFYEDDIACHRITNVTMTEFGEKVGSIFSERHKIINFDIVEGSEIEAPARGAVECFPEIPLVVKLHTPKFLVDKINKAQIYPVTKALHTLNLIRKGLNPIDFWTYNIKNDIERKHTLDADNIVILTHSMIEKVVKPWGLDSKKVSYIPNPYIPSKELLDIPADTQTNTITFTGRLEARKGVIDLAKSIPLILKVCPNTKFRFVGKTRNAPNFKMTMKEHLEEILKNHLDNVEFIDGVDLDEIPKVLRATDICIFPSIWENFPNVCLEAMAAARGIIGSNSGGMAEMLNNGEVGKLVPPHAPSKIAESAIELLQSPEKRMHMGLSARQRVLTEYNSHHVGKMIEDGYEKAIIQRKSQGPRENSTRSKSRNRLNSTVR